MDRLFRILMIVSFCFVLVACDEEDSYPKGYTKRYIEGQVLVENSKTGIANVVVSDGYSTVLTDESGRYEMDVNSNADFVFISIPSGYLIPEEKGIAKFYKRIDNNQDINFYLQESIVDNSKYAFIVWADPQIKSLSTSKLLNNEVAPTVKYFLQDIGDMPMWGISVGDLVSEKFDLFPDYINAVDKLDIPFFQVVGNHDMDYTCSSQKSAEKHYKSYFGPTYYSFNRGKIHYIVLNNVSINYLGTSVDPDDEYRGNFTGVQLNWLKNDLKYVDEGSTVVVAFHIPYFKLSDAIKSEFAEVIKPYNVHILSGHTHYNKNVEEDDVFEHNTAAVCASWWNSELCTDGTPAGYGVYLVDGTNISWYYKATKFSNNYQFKLFAPGYSDINPDKLVANVWNWDSKWKVEWYENGTYQGEMIQYAGYDPEAYIKMYGPKVTNHLFYAVPSNIANYIEVKVTDRFGNIYSKGIDF